MTMNYYKGTTIRLKKRIQEQKKTNKSFNGISKSTQYIELRIGSFFFALAMPAVHTHETFCPLCKTM